MKKGKLYVTDDKVIVMCTNSTKESDTLFFKGVVVVASGVERYNIGDYSDGWIISSFVENVGIISLNNLDYTKK